MEVSKIVISTILVAGFIVLALALLGEQGSFNNYTPSEQLNTLSQNASASLEGISQSLNSTQEALMSEQGGVSQVVTFILQGAISGARTFVSGLKYTSILFTTMLAYIGISGTAYSILVMMIASAIAISAIVMLIRVFSGGSI